MRFEVRVKVAMAVRVRDFLQAHPFGSDPADKVAAAYAERVTRAQALFTQQRAGEEARSASSRYRTELQRQIRRVPLRHLAKIARAVAAAHPEVSAGVSPARLSRADEAFQAEARVILEEVRAHRELYLEQGLTEASLDELAQMLQAYQQPVSDANAGRRAHTGASAEIRSLGGELMRMLSQFDGMMVYRLRDQPELAGA